MIRSVITVPKGVITGAFNILFSFAEDVDLRVENFRIETLSGDPLGHDPRNSLKKGNGDHYMFQCYIPKQIYGKSRVFLDLEGAFAKPVDIVYDTINGVWVEWGVPVRVGQKTEIPVSFHVPLRHLRKRNFRFSRAMPFQLYASDTNGYRLVIFNRDNKFSVTAHGTVTKATGVDSFIRRSILEV